MSQTQVFLSSFSKQAKLKGIHAQLTRVVMHSDAQWAQTCQKSLEFV